MKRLRICLAAAAVTAAALLASASPASAVNGAECDQTTQGAWWDSSADAEPTDIVDNLPAGLSPWRGRITCSWLSADGFVADGNPAYSMVFRGFPTSELPTLYEALISSGWRMNPPAINAGGGAGVVEDISDLASVADDVVYVDADGVTTDGTGWVSFRYDTTDGWYERGWDESSLVVAWWGTRPQAAAGITDPSTFSTLRTVSQALPTPAQTAVIAGSAVFLMLIVGWPGYLLNSVIGARYDDARGWVLTRTARQRTWARARIARVRGWLLTPAPPAPPLPETDAAPALAPTPPHAAPTPPAADAPHVSGGAPPRWLIWLGLGIAALISCFVDPAFGLNWMSVRLLLSAFVAFVAFNYGVLTITRLVVRRVDPDAPPRLEFRWTSLALVLAAVVLARVLGFHPGIVFGLVAGLAFAASLTRARSALVTLLGAGFGLVAGGIAWVLYSLLAPVAAAAPWLLVVSETLAGITLEGISALPIALLPLAALEGQKLFAWNRWAWAGAYTVGLAAFMLVLLNVPGSFGEIQGDFVRWVVLFVGFGAVAVGVWWLNARLERRRTAARPSDGDPGITSGAAPSPGVG